MRILLIGKYNLSFMNYFHQKGHSNQDLIEKGSTIINDALYVLETELDALGHEVRTLVIGLESEEEIIQKSKDFKPDIIHIGSYFEYYGDFLKTLRENSDAKVSTWINRPLVENMNMEHIDRVFTGRPQYVDYFSGKGIKATEAIVGYPNNYKLNHKKTIDVGFIGAIDGLFTKVKYHQRRTELIKYLSKNIDLHKWGYGFLSDSGLKSTIKKILNGGKLYQNYHGEVWGEDMFQVLNRFKISVNCHAEVAGDYAVNNRMFETTGAGTLLITDDQKYLSKYFEPDKDVITYKSKEECLEKIHYLLQNEAELKSITKAGQERTLKNYTVKHFAERFDQELKLF